MKKYIKILVLILFLAIGVSAFFGFSKDEKVFDKIEINDVEFYVEVVVNELNRARGLGGRDGLCEKCGMVFVFDEVGRHGFWMKNMRFDIDILWIRDGEIVHIEKSVSHEMPEVIYNPDVESDMVLELDAGVVDEFGIEVGDKLTF